MTVVGIHSRSVIPGNSLPIASVSFVGLTLDENEAGHNRWINQFDLSQRMIPAKNFSETRTSWAIMVAVYLASLLHQERNRLLTVLRRSSA
jgi:hypothetical protein